MDRLTKALRSLAVAWLALLVILAGCKSGNSRFAAVQTSMVQAHRETMACSSGLSIPRDGSPVANDIRSQVAPPEASPESTRDEVSMVAFRGVPETENERQATSTIVPTTRLEPVEMEDISAPLAAVTVTDIDEVSDEASQLSDLSLSLQDAIATSLVQNPDLIAARGQEQVSTAAVGVAETYIWNPFVQSQIRPGDGRGGQSNYYLWLMQRFELAHQQKFREQGALSLLNQVRWNIHQTELTNIATTSQFYLTALYQWELFELANQTAKLNEDLLGIVQRRFKAGVGTAAQVTTAKVAARQSANQARLADTNFQTSLLALRRQLNLSPSEPVTLIDRLPAFDWHPASDFTSGAVQSDAAGADVIRQLAAELIEGRPDVMAAFAGVNAACANARLAKAAQTPDVQAGPILDKNANGSYDVGVRLQRDLFVWNNGRPLTRQRNAEWQQQNRIYTQLKTRATREAETAIDRYERARELVDATKVDLSPIAENMPPDLKDINTQFQAGQADVLIVYATQNALLQDRRTYLDSLNELAQSAAAVVQATAVPVERIVARNNGPNYR